MGPQPKASEANYKLDYKMWFIVDSCGILCILITYSVILGVSGLCTKIALVPLSDQGYISLFGALFGYVLILGLGSISHIGCVFTDPGSLLKNTELPPVEDPAGPPSLNYCRKCRCYKPRGAHHCSMCNRCIQKMDHHCPWVNNCVGLYNQKLFLLFLFYIELGCIYTFVWLGIRGTFCFSHKEAALCHKSTKDASDDVMLGIICVFGAGVFSLFVGIMMYDQLHCIVNNTTGIDQLKKVKPESRSVRESFEEVFGGHFGWHWFLPLPLKRASYTVLYENEL